MEHEGVIIDTKAQTLYVQIEQRSACSACHAKTSCGMSETKKKIVEVNDTSHDWKPGMHVRLSCSTSMGLKAVGYAFVLPLLLIVLTLILCLSWQLTPALSAILSLAVTLPYYITLHIFRNKLKKEFTFSIK